MTRFPGCFQCDNTSRQHAGWVSQSVTDPICYRPVVKGADARTCWHQQRCLQINTAIAPVLGGGHAVLFGSLPAGLALPQSDIDVVLVEDNPTTSLPTAAGYAPGDRSAVAAQLTKVRCRPPWPR